MSRSGVAECLCLVNAMHITASVFINDASPGGTTTTKCGWRNWPRTPPHSAYRHNRAGETFSVPVYSGQLFPLSSTAKAHARENDWRIGARFKLRANPRADSQEKYFVSDVPLTLQRYSESGAAS